MNRKWWLAGGLAVVVAGVGGAWQDGLLKGRVGAPGLAVAQSNPSSAPKDGKDGGGDKKPDVPLEFAPHEVVQPALARLPGMVAFSGPLVAPQTAIVRAKAGGTLLASAAEGRRVKAGQVLATIDPTEVSSRLAERQAMVESARATLVQAERTHLNNQRLADQQFISATALDQSRAALDAARANERAALAQQDTVRALSRDTRVTAPFDGIVAKRHAVAGEKVAAEQPVATIVDLARLELAGTVGTHEVARLAPGVAVQLWVEGIDEAAAGKIARIAPAAEPGTRSIGVTIELANPGERLRAGQYALARVEVADPQSRLTVPAGAVGNTAGQDHVWLIENGVLARRDVTLGRRDTRAGRVELLSGVTEGSQVLAARFENLREGAKAAVVAVKGAAVASAAASAPLAR
jgi:RND family efflux transporter MFP subunit